MDNAIVGLRDGWANEVANEIAALIERQVADAIEKASPMIIAAAVKRASVHSYGHTIFTRAKD